MTKIRELVFFSRLFSEFHRKRIHTVTRISRSESLSMEHMTEVSTTARTRDLSTTTISINCLEYSPLDRCIKRRPSTSRMEFEFTSIEIDSALTTGIDAIFEGIGILSFERHLCTLSDDDASFLGSEGIIGGIHKKNS